MRLLSQKLRSGKPPPSSTQQQKEEVEERKSWNKRDGKQQNKTTTTSMSKSTIPINVLCILNGKPNANIARKRKDKKNNEKEIITTKNKLN